MRDPYDILGVPRSASDADIKKAYRRLAKTHHPDQNRNDPKSKDRFAELNNAYEIVGDAEKRKAFDRGEIDASGKPRFQAHDGFSGRRAGGAPGADPFEHFEAGFGPNGPFQRRHAGGRVFEGNDFFDIFSTPFGAAGGGQRGHAKPPKGDDVEIKTTITLEDIALRRPAQVTLPSGRTVEVALPDAVEDGKKMRLRGQGKVSPLSGEAGDAILILRLAPHKLFRLDGHNLHLDLPLSIDEAVLGAPVRVPTLTGAVELTIPAGANDGRVMRLRGKGLPHKASAGDLFVTLRIRLPEGDSRLTGLAEALRASGSYKARGPEFD